MIMLIHPETGDVQVIRRSDTNKMATFRDLVLDGYNPVGPRGQDLASRIRAS